MNIPARDQTTPARALLLLLGPHSRGGGGVVVLGGRPLNPGQTRSTVEAGEGEGRRRMREKATTVAGSGFDGGT